jgi:glycosyltransferase involved in cell wall biosynthesis
VRECSLKKIIIIGRTPKPYGGLAIFVQRLASQYEVGGNQVEIIDPRKKMSVILFLIRMPFIHFDKLILNNFSIIMFLMLIFSKKSKLCTLVDHNHSRHINKKGVLSKALLRFSVKRFDKLWLVGEHLKQNYINNLIEMPADTFVKSPYIAVSPTVMKCDYENVPNIIKDLIETNEQIFINSSSQDITDLSADIYGIQSSIEAFASIGNERAHLIISHTHHNSIMAKQIEMLCLSLNVVDSVSYVKGDFPLWATFSKISAFLRTTKTDGDSVSVKEALDSGAKVIASNVVPRPKGTLTYDVNNTHELAEKMQTIISSVDL